MSGPSCKDDGDDDGDGDDDDDEDELSAAISAQVAPSFTPVASFKMVYVSPTELRQLINKEAELLPNQVDEVHAHLEDADRVALLFTLVCALMWVAKLLEKMVERSFKVEWNMRTSGSNLLGTALGQVFTRDY